jgi:hypothetical protein
MSESSETEGLSPSESAQRVNQSILNERIEEGPTEPGLGANSTLDRLLDRFKNTEPHTPIDEMDIPRDLERNWTGYLFRGLGKFLGTDTKASAFDLVAGFYGMTKSIFTPSEEIVTEENQPNIPGDNDTL